MAFDILHEFTCISQLVSLQYVHVQYREKREKTGPAKAVE